VDRVGDEVASEVAARLSTVEPRRTRVLVTGVGGFIGGFLARYLADHGYEVVGTARDRGRVAAEIRVVCLAIHEFEINGSSDWASVLEGIDVVVHCAAHVHVRRPSDLDQRLFREVNVEGARSLAQACRALDVRLLINISSIAADPLIQDAKSRGYGLSKREAEQAVAEVLAEGQCAYLNLRLPAVYGPGSKGALRFVQHWVSRGLPLPDLAESPKRSYLSVWNLADCIQHCIEQSSIKSETVALADPLPLNLVELLTVISEAFGRRPRFVPVAGWLVATLVRAMGIGREFGRGMTSAVIDPADAEAKLRWRPVLGAREAWRREAGASRV
jgi:nucleoside-diphosphate-sugar epimerase